MNQTDLNQKPDYDELIQNITDYIINTPIESRLAYDTAHQCLFDSLGCALLALNYPACTQLLGPVIPGLELTQGVPIPGTNYRLDPVQAAFNIGTQIRWLDYNDTWLAAEWGHPSDNLGAILAVSDYLTRTREQKITIKNLLTMLIKAYEIQGVLALENAFNAHGLDHVLLVKLASAAVTAHLLGGTRQQILDTITHAFLDGHALRTYRHAPNTGHRKSWAAGDATSRAVRLALLVQAGEMGYPSVLSVPKWGFQDVYWQSQSLTVSQDFNSYVMEHILFKISYPAEFHAQTAVECAIALHNQVNNRITDIARIECYTQAAAVRIISKTGPLHNPADRDHCLQYMVAIGLLYGTLNADHYENKTASNPNIDLLREKMQVSEDPQFTRDYLDPNKRAIPNAIQVFFNDGSATERIQIDYPVGHRRRRKEGQPLLRQKLLHNLKRLSTEQQQRLLQWYDDPTACGSVAVTEFMDAFAFSSQP